MADLAVGHHHHPNVSMSAGVQDQPRIADEEDGSLACCCIPGLATLQEPVTVGDMDRHPTSEAFWLWPAGPLLFENLGSETRDHCANERNFLSYLRLSIYTAIVSVAIVLSFHLKQQATPLELRLATPLGVIFSSMSVLCLGAGLANYIRTINRFGRRQAIVQTGPKTQVIMAGLVIVLVGSCIALLVVDRMGM